MFDRAVLGSSAEAFAALGALGLAAGRVRTAVVVSDMPTRGSAIAMPATSAARRLARSIAGCGRSAARGRLAFLHAERDMLVPAAREVAQRAKAPVVLALSEPRDDVADALLAESVEIIVLADPDGPLAALALFQLGEIGLLATALAPTETAGVALARFGWSAPPWLSTPARKEA